MAEPRLHFAVALEKAKGGWRVVYVIPGFKSRGEADIASLSLAARFADTAGVTLPREIETGDLLTAAELKR